MHAKPGVMVHLIFCDLRALPESESQKFRLKRNDFPSSFKKSSGPVYKYVEMENGISKFQRNFSSS